MKRTGILFAFLVCCLLARGQEENIIPNPGFEEYEGFPMGWNHAGKDFDRLLRYWDSPTNASPDVYGPDVIVPGFWSSKGFGDASPYQGKSMIGLTLFGCEKGKPHCREYVQTELYEPLVPGQRYRLSVWTRSLPRALRIDRIGFAFSEKRLSQKTEQLINLEPVFEAGWIVQSRHNAWQRLDCEFVAKEPKPYFLMGNFAPDNETRTDTASNDPLFYAYYYFDDVRLEKLPPILEPPLQFDDLSLKELEPGKTIYLNNIHFGLDKAELTPMSHVELRKLFDIMRENPSMEIEVIGHTDKLGTEDYNKDLSERRALAVVRYLVTNGISPDRLAYSGKGSKDPLASNVEAEGRQLNRRVEFRILRLDQ